MTRKFGEFTPQERAANLEKARKTKAARARARAGMPPYLDWAWAGQQEQEIRMTQAQIDEWRQDLREIGRIYHVRISSKSGIDDKSARRIAILVRNGFLARFEPTTHHKAAAWQRLVNLSGFIEGDVYQEARRLHISCLEIESEERIMAMGHKAKGFDVLKLNAEVNETNAEIMQIIFENLLNSQKGEPERAAGKRNVRGRKVVPPRIAHQRHGR